MDQSPAAVIARRQVANALTAYAHQQGWAPKDYEVWMRFNPDWGRVHVVFVARAFEGQDNYRCYSDVKQFLEQELKEEPELLEAIGLVVKDAEQAAEGGIFGIGPEYELVNLSEATAGGKP